tara:strand:- start:3734 stop:4639 length:906 start_codon:yes stop_codon:yes gene_type:complete
MANLIFNGTSGMWVNQEKPGGRVVFVGGGTVAAKGRSGSGIGASDTNDGRTPEQPKLTIQAALNRCTAGRGDTVVLLPGSTTLTAALTMSNDDVTLTGVSGNGTLNPSAIVVNATVDGIAVTGANVVIEDLHFSASTAAATSRINAGAAGLVVRGCTFECGATDLESITIPAAGLHTTVRGNRFYVTANGPDAAIEIEAAGAHYVVIEDNDFNGMNDSNGWDVGAINSGVAHLSCLVGGNRSSFGPAIIFSAAATGLISGNTMGEGTLGSMLDPGSCMCSENYEADAIDQSARLFPGTVAS